MFRNLSYLIILLFCGAVSLQAQEREYVIVVHGGAGVIDKLEKDPESMNRDELTKLIADIQKKMQKAAALL